MEKAKSGKKPREAGMMTATGIQGVGKTYQHMHQIADYVKDNMAKGVLGRRVLIFDTNGEFTESQFAENGIPNFKVKTLRLKDTQEWSLHGPIECRRIDGKNLSIPDKKTVLEYLIKCFRNGMLVIEDINTYLLNVTHMEEIVGGLVNLRHRAVDVLISYQSLRPVEPRIWQNSRWIRMHYQADRVEDIKNKVNNPELFKIAQLIVNNRYLNREDKRFFLYIYNFENKIQGAFSKAEFKEAATKYLRINKGRVKERMDVDECSKEEATQREIVRLYKEYYGNSDKDVIKIKDKKGDARFAE